MELRARTKTAFDRVFPERQIYHRSGGTVKYISVSPWQQAIIATGAVAVAGWCLFATASYIFTPSTGTFEAGDSLELARYERWVQQLRDREALSRSLLEQRTDEFQQATLNLHQRHAVLEELLGALQSGEEIELTALRGNGAAVLLDATIEEADARQSRDEPLIKASLEVVGMRAEISELQRQQDKFLNEAEEIAVQRAERARGILKLTAVGTSRIGADVESGVGGPLIELDSLGIADIEDPVQREFALRVGQVAARMEEARYYETIVTSLPLAEPGGVPLRITSNYGLRADPFKKTQAWHSGIDLGAFYNAPIAAAGPGVVTFAGRRTGYGRTVEIDHGFGFKSRYAHLNRISVKKGDKVALGDKVGAMGSSGRSTGPHLHYEVMLNGKHYDPTPFLKAGKHVYEG